MENICKVIKLEYPVILIKYFLPIIIILIGIIKLITIKKKKKAKKVFLICFILSIITLLGIIFLESIINNKCKTYNEKEPDKTVQQLKIEEPPKKEESKIKTINGVTYVDGILIVNKTYSVPEDYMPDNANNYDRCNECLTEETMHAFNEMKADASSLGLNLYISSGYRSYSYQTKLYNNYVNRDGKILADKYSARPGYSEHQTGLAFDLNTIDDSFALTEEGKWIADSCYKYGLILRYPKGKEEETGYQYESWHLRYVGKELASKLYNNGNWITLEEYYNLKSEYE